MKTKLVVWVMCIIFIISGIFIYSNRKENSDSFLINNINSAQSTQVNGQNNEDIFVYETEAESKDDCSSYEEFNPENNTCYFECTSTKECREMEKSIDDELSQWLNKDGNDKNFEESGKDADDTLVSEYTVEQKENITLKKGKKGSDDLTVWQHISKMSPDNLSDGYIESFMIFNDPKNDTLAFVDDNDMNGKWRIGINLYSYKSSTVRERNMTIVHELGHIVTLNNSQIKNIPESTCKNYFTSEGCAESTSYLNKYIKNFWSLADIQKANNEEDIYSENKFLTEYAASGPEEDIAESFAYFVLDGKNNGADIKDKKSAFFYNYPELIKVRESMRAGVYSDVIRSRKIEVQ